MTILGHGDHELNHHDGGEEGDHDCPIRFVVNWINGVDVVNEDHVASPRSDSHDHRDDEFDGHKYYAKDIPEALLCDFETMAVVS